jgi:hypothetical protein
VKGFPRPLYPPDVPEASGYEPSTRGPDVVAYKRTICRLGRWGTWNPSSWDDGYWTTFAHGKGGASSSVEDSGVAGFQRQQPLDATGWLGEQTFSALCYALVPNDSSFPHAGEQAMDGVACQLIDDAWDLFQGHDIPPSTATVRGAALKRAQSQIGVVESPSGSNLQRYGSWYGVNGVPWCAIFATWSFELGATDIGEDSPSFVRGSRYAYVPYIVSDARGKAHDLKTVDPSSAQPGDLVCYDWQWNGEYDHVGIFEQWVGPSTFTAIEGNTSTSNNSNGGQVMRRTRTLGQQATVFVRVAEP